MTLRWEYNRSVIRVSARCSRALQYMAPQSVPDSTTAFWAPQGTRIPPPPPGKSSVRESKVTVKIPRPLYRKIQQVVEDSGFNSPTDFIVYVLRDLMGEAESNQPVEFNQDELDDVKRKLKNLGYL